MACSIIVTDNLSHNLCPLKIYLEDLTIFLSYGSSQQHFKNTLIAFYILRGYRFILQLTIN